MYVVYKKWGETPLEALTRLRAQLNIAKDIPMTYAGRLDPAAEGLLLILVGETCKEKETYTALEKTYTAEILLGVSTDSHDLLGMPVLGNSGDGSQVEDYFKSHIGIHTQKYPHYSSPRLANPSSGEMNHEVELHSYSNFKIESRTREEVLTRVQKLTQVVAGDFRQAEIAGGWSSFAQSLPEKLSVVSVVLSVGSGYYIRQLAQDVGEALGIGACLYSLVRTKVGEHTKADF